LGSTLYFKVRSPVGQQQALLYYRATLSLLNNINVLLAIVHLFTSCSLAEQLVPGYTHYMSELLDVVNERDEVTGQAERDEVHRLGLVCRLVYLCFYTSSGDVILQKRSVTKKNDPGKLTAAASGHVAAGQSYLEAAVRETFEETGIQIQPNQLVNLGTVRVDYTQGNYISNAMRAFFAYK